ncbi:MAG: glycosyltransferase, partial [Candidatus Didemnitutus sp.]|nr:glycosyltransferase [Candidatus Didemnitutus sp.]
RSILGQTLTDFELVIIDDGTGAGLSALGDDAQDPRLRLVSFPEKRGIACARNAARSTARGEFIALMDSDDLCLPDRLARQVTALREDPKLGLLYTHAWEIDADDRVTGSRFTLTTPREHREFSAFGLPATNPSLAGRREVFERFPYREEFIAAEDFDFMARAVEVWPSRALAEQLFFYRRHAMQVTEEIPRIQALHTCVCQLLTARRRSGRSEEMASLRDTLDAWHASPPPGDALYAGFARLALAEKLTLPAVYFARKLLSVRRDLSAAATATRVLAAALRLEPRHSALLLRLFFTGPLRAHSLRPS